MGIKDSNYVTNLKYLTYDLKRVLYLPKALKPVIDKIFPNIIRVLGAILGFGRKTNQAIRLPEYFMKLKDGTRLATDVFIPKKILKNHGKCPTILVRMPYWKDNWSFIGYAYASYGYAVVIQDVRGTGHSEGMSFILITDREDGLEALRWITKQFWYDGKIGLSGASYFAFTQWCIAWDNDNLLMEICPAISAYTMMLRLHGGLNPNSFINAFKRILINVTIHKDTPKVDTFTPEMVESLLNPQMALFNEPLNINKPKLSHFEGLPIEVVVKFMEKLSNIKKLDLRKRNYKFMFELIETVFEKLDIDHNNMPGMLDLDLKKMTQPALMLSGWYDLFIEHTLKDYLDIKANATGIAQKHTRMIIGPTGHGSVGMKTNKLDNGLIDFLRGFLAKEWHEHWLKGADEPELKKPTIKYFVMNANVWRYTEKWPPERVIYKNIYFHSKGRANSKKGNGRLSFREPLEEPDDNFKFDPMNPVITRGGRNLEITSGARDQNDSEIREDVLVYTSEPFEHGIELTGDIKIVLYASSSAKDTDFMVKLVDVSPNGKAYNILDAGVRARFRNGRDNPELIEPGNVVKYEFLVGNTSNFFKPRHRIRVDITSSNFPRYDVNSNMGGDGELGDYLIAEQKIYHNKEYPSHLILSIYI
jgi:putative CocE/NonD family hydrolase